MTPISAEARGKRRALRAKLAPAWDRAQRGFPSVAKLAHRLAWPTSPATLSRCSEAPALSCRRADLTW